MNMDMAILIYQESKKIQTYKSKIRIEENLKRDKKVGV